MTFYICWHFFYILLTYERTVVYSFTKKTINYESNSENELSIIAHRKDEVPGTHEVKYSSDIDDIEIKHKAKSRMGFALGAVIAAEWIVGKQGFYGMSDVLQVNLR